MLTQIAHELLKIILISSTIQIKVIGLDKIGS